MGVVKEVTPSNNDQRLFERLSTKLPAKIKDSRESFGDNLYLKDASAQGVQLASRERFYVNDSVAVDVQMQRSYPLTVHGSVVWVNKEDENYWDIGVKFHKIHFLHLARLVEYLMPDTVDNS